ncbi:MAG: response regulator transcription factor [Hyphomicrobiales bacterium]|nr:response regulator transcription factor [Hyphomicrobiales bacterium]
MKALIIEDDLMLGDALVAALNREGVAVDWVRRGADAEEALRDDSYAVVLLDLGLPDADGMDLLRLARQRGFGTPVLVVTARDAIDDRVAGLDIGADDYLVKPFETRELLARIRALLRRREGRASLSLTAGACQLDPETHELTHNGRTLALPAREFALMYALMERPGRILSRTRIEERIYGWGEEVESNAVDVLIHSIRRKFTKDVILNVRGAGWMVPKS